MGKCRGFTLLEIAVAILLTSVVATAVFSVALSFRRSSGKSDRKLVAAQYARQMSDILRHYVNANLDDSETTILGPTPRINQQSWHFHNPPALVDSGGNVYALANGSHTITGFLPTWFSAPPYNAILTYFVDRPSPPGNMPRVNITVDWTDP